MSVIKNIRVTFYVAWYANPSVGQGTIVVKEGEGYTSPGFAISPDHRFLVAKPYDLEEKDPMHCEVGLKPGFLTQLGNLFKGNSMFRTAQKNVSVLKATSFPLSEVKNITFNNNYDDSHYSFYDADKLSKKEKK